ncbi:MAG: hypothetical protein IPN70_02940 [Candidatus Moraniibacteriota bacterium]|nr:MAG: hypothetical protein IPN70_02940 [Candidatus Moranbacteria bacterium]
MLNSTVWQLRDHQAGSNGVPVRGALKKNRLPKIFFGIKKWDGNWKLELETIEMQEII